MGEYRRAMVLRRRRIRGGDGALPFPLRNGQGRRRLPRGNESVMPLRFKAVLVASVFAVAVLVQTLGAQTPDSSPAFEVASIKPNKSDVPVGPGYNMAGPNLSATNVP